MHSFGWLTLLLVLVALPGCTAPAPVSAAGGLPSQTFTVDLPAHESAQLTVMTFNIRYGTAKDGDFAWPKRRQLVADLIRRESPDVLAIQEGLAFQLEELADVLRDYTKFGQHRDGGLGGEFSGLYVRTAIVTRDTATTPTTSAVATAETSAIATLVDSGELWLSPTPTRVASKGWDAALPRMAVWVDLLLIASPGAPNHGVGAAAGNGAGSGGIDRGNRGDLIRVYGTHFDHRGVEARLRSAELLLSHAQSGPPAVFMGDFNAEEDSAPIQTFFAAQHQSAILLCDPGNTLGTFNGFKFADGGRRIDHILCAPGIVSIRAQIHSDQINGIWPSDHFPVSATVRHTSQP